MRFVTFRKHHASEDRLGVVDGDHVVDLASADASVPTSLRAALAAGVDVVGAARRALAKSDVERLPRSSLTMAPLVPDPAKIICLGHNYFEHAKEGGNLKPTYPQIFFRGSSSLVADGDPVIRPRVSDKFDFEAELAVVIGTKARHVKRADALKHVFGYACFNDVTVRDYQKRTTQWTIGKNFDGTGAFGPELVTPDELPPGAAGLSITLRLNGNVMQHANTSDMIWGVAETIELLTECMTLEPGDVIITGTPAGVGWARTPPLFMKDGDDVEVDIERVGVLRNRVKDEAAASVANEAAENAAESAA